MHPTARTHTPLLHSTMLPLLYIFAAQLLAAVATPPALKQPWTNCNTFPSHNCNCSNSSLACAHWCTATLQGLNTHHVYTEPPVYPVYPDSFNKTPPSPNSPSLRRVASAVEAVKHDAILCVHAVLCFLEHNARCTLNDGVCALQPTLGW